jgi:pilus assembly protein CpaC
MLSKLSIKFPDLGISQLLKHILVFSLAISLSNIPNFAFSAESHETLSMAVGKSRTYSLKNPVSRISVANPAIADVLDTSGKDLTLLAKKPGSTNITLFQSNGRSTVLDIFVSGDTSYVKGLVNELIPDSKNVKITGVGDSYIVTGSVGDAETVSNIIKIVEEATGAKKVVNMLNTDSPSQVMLEVKVAEIDKTLADSLGIQLQGTNFSFNLLGSAALGFSAPATANFGAGEGATQSWLQANIQNGLVKILAEPTIVAISGQEGQFLSGGTVYLPVPQASATGSVITLQAVPYGIGVKFTPTVLANGKINLKVNPQVSQVSPTGVTVTAGGQTQVIPQILSRSAATTVQLYDGQSFAIGGLISNNVNEVISAFPWLANLPIIGALFRSSSFQNNRTELMIVVTPKLVTATNEKPVLPTDKFVLPSQSEFFFGGKLEGQAPVEPATNQ